MGEVATLLTTPGVSEEDARKIMMTTAARALDFDLDALRPHIDRVGFEPSDIVARADELTSDLPDWDTPFKNEGNVLTNLVRRES